MATTGVTFDIAALRAMARPDPLAEAVLPTSDSVFQVSHVLPFVRLINQDVGGISPWRRALLRTWRTSKLANGDESVNESLHESAAARFGKRVPLRRGEAVQMVAYRPRQLQRALMGPGRR